MKIHVVGLTLLTCTLATISANAGDDMAAQEKLDEATSLFAERGVDLTPTTKAVEVLGQAEALADDLDLKFDIMVLASRALYWNAKLTSDNGDKKTLHWAGYEKGKAAAEMMKKAGMDWYAEGYYYAGINLGKWGLANGIQSSLGRRCELVHYAKVAMSKGTRSGEPGITIDGYGPYRTLAKLHKELPDVDFAMNCSGGEFNYPDEDMGDNGLAREYATKSVELTTNPAATGYVDYKVLLNTVFLAELSDKVTACNLLRDLIKNETGKDEDQNGLDDGLEAFNPDRVPETVEELNADAKPLFADLKCSN